MPARGAAGHAVRAETAVRQGQQAGQCHTRHCPEDFQTLEEEGAQQEGGPLHAAAAMPRSSFHCTCMDSQWVHDGTDVGRCCGAVHQQGKEGSCGRGVVLRNRVSPQSHYMKFPQRFTSCVMQ